MDPQQELFTEILVRLRAQFGETKVFDGFLPPDGTPYPFIYLADSQQVDEANKSAVFGSVSQTIHVWNNDPEKRGTLSKMLLAVKETCRGIEHTGNFAWWVKDVSQRILPDTSTAQPLLHGVLEIEFMFS